MKETPIIMNGNHPRLILDGTKTMTRRVIKPQPIIELVQFQGFQFNWKGKLLWKHKLEKLCPYGQVGDRLVIKEAWATENQYNHLKPSEVPQTAKIWYLADEQYDPYTMGKVRSAMFICNWMSRARPEITEVRAERLQEISLPDIVLEGVDIPNEYWGITNPTGKFYAICQLFEDLWDSLNTKRGYGWEVNPFVWVISFRLLTTED